MARLARWGLIAAAAMVGVALLATVWSTYRSVDSASRTLVRGQSDLLRDAIRVRLARSVGRVSAADAQAIVDEYSREGLRYLAVLDRDGNVLVHAGAPEASPQQLALALARRRPFEPMSIGDRVLVASYHRSSHHHHHHRRGGAAARRRRRWFVPFAIEFEPEVAAGLKRAAWRTLAIGAVAAAGFLIMALALVRWLLRREALERTLEHERRLASLGQMSAVLAHELRNPLASLKGNAQLLSRALPDGERPRAKADRVVKEAIRLEALTNDLLEFVRGGDIRREDGDPVALARDAAASVEGGAIRLEADGAPAVWSLDPERMRQVLTNLFENAVQAGGGEVVATIAEEQGALVYRVRDHGPGLSGADPARLFEPFYTRRTRGTGLGLAVAKRLVDLHGGTIAARDAAGGGAVFEVRVPR